MRRGEIWWAELPEPMGSSPSGRRPVLIVQSNRFNASGVRTVIVVALTRTLKLADAPGNVFVSHQESGLSDDSVVNVSQLAAIDKGLLVNRVGTVSSDVMAKVNEGLKLILGI